MKNRRAIVRAFGGEPLDRVVIGFENGAFLVVRKDRIEAIESGDSLPVGFHASDVFEFDPYRYQALIESWKNSGSIAESEWEAQSPLRPLV